MHHVWVQSVDQCMHVIIFIIILALFQVSFVNLL